MDKAAVSPGGLRSLEALETHPHESRTRVIIAAQADLHHGQGPRHTRTRHGGHRCDARNGCSPTSRPEKLATFREVLKYLFANKKKRRKRFALLPSGPRRGWDCRQGTECRQKRQRKLPGKRTGQSSP